LKIAGGEPIILRHALYYLGLTSRAGSEESTKSVKSFNAPEMYARINLTQYNCSSLAFQVCIFDKSWVWNFRTRWHVSQS